VIAVIAAGAIEEVVGLVLLREVHGDGDVRRGGPHLRLYEGSILEGGERHGQVNRSDDGTYDGLDGGMGRG
jgi:hypothetical protein